MTQVERLKEWKFYQDDLSLSIVDDNYFVRMTEAVWGVSEDATITVKKTELEHITKTIRQRLQFLSSVNQSGEAVMRAVFREFDGANGSGMLTSDLLQQMLVKLQVCVDQRYLDALLKRFDRRGDGVIEFEELVGYLMENPYK